MKTKITSTDFQAFLFVDAENVPYFNNYYIIAAFIEMHYYRE